MPCLMNLGKEFNFSRFKSKKVNMHIIIILIIIIILLLFVLFLWQGLST